MKKWQELTINAFMNLGIGLMAGGILKLVLDFSSIISSVVISFLGAYILLFASLTAKSIEERG
ncbi:hypothetical protein LMG7974_01623 [Campylobacter majalis]|uniref:Uncharacterized protein n=1 Tax=Campylobacter majalis TaxID=2790656 RepID=A0ABN7KAS5_9BACT|nr:hypothetical protein [Campylobacter majalis]CAD7289546.1 hypothetical protein LMG7974_01623 [Campylobacter majalis]